MALTLHRAGPIPQEVLQVSFFQCCPQSEKVWEEARKTLPWEKADRYCSLFLRQSTEERQHRPSPSPRQMGIWHDGSWSNDPILLDAQSSHLPRFWYLLSSYLTFSSCKLFGSSPHCTQLHSLSSVHLSRLISSPLLPSTEICNGLLIV